MNSLISSPIILIEANISNSISKYSKEQYFDKFSLERGIKNVI